MPSISLSALTSPVCPFVVILLWLLWKWKSSRTANSDIDNIPGPSSGSFFKGNFGQLFNPYGTDFHLQLGRKFGGMSKIFGPFGSSELYIFDPKALHHILIKDQYTYEETTAFVASNNLVFGDGLLSSLGERHKKQRKLLNPAFAVGHMRGMVPIMEDVAKKLKASLRLEIKRGAQQIDMLHWLSRSSLEIIGLCGLGRSLDPLIEGVQPHPFGKAAIDLVPVLFSFEFEREYLLPFLVKYFSVPVRKRMLDLLLKLPRWGWARRVERLKQYVDIMDESSVALLEERKREVEAERKVNGNKVEGWYDDDKRKGKDILTILVRANMEASVEDRLADTEVLGQLSTFTFGGTDTTSNAFAKFLYLLAKYPEVQERLREEVKEAWERYGGGDEDDDDNDDEGSSGLTYDVLMALPFLDAVCRETLRLYPPVPTAIRTSRKDTVIPLSKPIKGIDGREMTSIFVPNNRNIVISILNANQDPSLWGEDAAEWKPERWMKGGLPQSLTDAHVPGVYGHTLTFLGGGRSCVGFKFSELEIKVVLSSLLRSFRFKLTQDNILWEMGGIVSPSVEGRLGEPRLPLVVERL